MANVRFLASLLAFLERRGRFCLALLSLGAAAVVAATWRSDDRDREELVARARSEGLVVTRHAPLVFQLSREADPGERRLAAARMQLANSRSTENKAALTGAELQRRLEAIEALAREALALLPASWEASMFLGAARFEKLLVARDTRLFSAAARWELPMTAAVARSHGRNSAEESLATVYLEVFPALSPERRPAVEELLRKAFADLQFRRRRIQRLLSVASTLEQAEKLLPVTSETLDALAEAAWSRRDASAAIDYWSRQRAQLRQELASALDSARQQIDQAGNRSVGTFNSVVLRSVLDQEFVPLVQEALVKLRPRAVMDRQLTGAAAKWLAWAQPLCLNRTCPLTPESFEKLVILAAPKPNSEAAAFASLAAGDTARAEKLARDTGALVTAAWADYVMFAAKRQSELNESGAAALLLSRVNQSAHDRPIWAALGRRAGLPEPPEKAALLRQESWGPTAWRRVSDWLTLELGIGRRSSGLEISLREKPKSDLLLEPEWDGRRLEPHLVRAGSSSLRLELDIAPGIHVLRLWALAGRLPSPGTTALD